MPLSITSYSTFLKFAYDAAPRQAESLNSVSFERPNGYHIGNSIECVQRKYTAQDKNVVNHNEQGELIRNGETVTGSHIVDLIHYTVSTRQRKEPIGSKEFQILLRKMNVPKNLIAERGKKSLTQTGGLFVKKKGRRDIMPGTTQKKEKIQWIKY
ncbi:Hypothetical predicted protein [Mytilus galloprovincialis]|uniref:Uncharacterized protein n=1 Tax=Mytilus galloprovincialis TaxID=29158 RepID=A0A8B6C5F6_MYTGA|nr:Hypothetical predicted protein [Mytilus galloprovincialis]